MYFLEIISKVVSKGSAAKQVKELIGADKMVAFGDNLNDIPLFEAADECYAVGNAENYVVYCNNSIFCFLSVLKRGKLHKKVP